VVPANGASTVQCIAAATAPITPIVTDFCGNIITPVLVNTVNNPNPLTCEGTRVYTYIYTDCAGNATNWVYTYTIDLSTSPIVPANGSSTVACITLAVVPSLPSVIDFCGNILPAVLISTVDNPNPFVCSGTRIYNYRYTDCSGSVSNWSYTYTISAPILSVTCPTDQTFDAAPGNIYTIPNLIASDNCTGGMTVSYAVTGATIRNGVGTNASGLFNVGVSTIDWTVTDVCGVVYTCSTIVTINFPIIICPANFNVCIDAGLQTLTGTGESPSGGVFSGSGIILNSGIYSFNPAIGAGTYTITYTWHNVNNYIGTCTFDITVNPKPTSNSSVLQDPLCFGDSNGIVSVNVLAGTPDFNIDWGIGSIITASNSYTILNLPMGNYNITVTDDNGCSYVTNSNLNQPSILSGTITITSNYNGQNVSCHSSTNGSAIVNPNGGTAPYTYLWSASAGSQVTQQATNLSAGTHSVLVNDSHGCTVLVNVTISEPVELSVLFEVNNNVLCHDGSDGNVTATATGGTPLYSYLWNDPAGTNTRFATQLPVGTWTVVVTDANSCVASKFVEISEPTPINLTFTNIQNVTCFGMSNGELGVSATGGTPGPNYYYYQWSDPSSSEDPIIFDLSANTYFVTVTDENSCTAISSYNITQPDPIVIQVNSQPVICGTTLGSASVLVSGGIPSYTFEWSNGTLAPFASNLTAGDHTIDVSDANGCSNQMVINIGIEGSVNVAIIEQSSVSCFGGNDANLETSISNGMPNYIFNWSNGVTTLANSNIGAGTYNVFVTDSWGCTGSATYDVGQPDDMFLSFITTDVTCKQGSNGEVTVSAVGGTAPYSAYWMDGPYSFTFSNLVAGSYEVLITDAVGCEKTGIAVVNQPNNPLIIDVDVNDISCYGFYDGAAVVHASGGTPDFDYHWFGMNTTSTDSIISSLVEGFYYLTVSDANNCLTDTSIIITQPAPLIATVVSDNPSCIGNDDGSIELTVLGGSLPYSYFYNNFTSEIPLLLGLVQGEYIVEIEDARGCDLSMGTIILTDVDQDCIVIPNAFTPNDDGVNDTWIIENIEMFPDAVVKVFNRWGQLLWEANPSIEWDGLYNGKKLPTGTYIYVIELFSGEAPRTGNITIVY
jgi:gliding motility-associated-like protein